jgi:DNA polymerase III epsilon subunit-like protein
LGHEIQIPNLIDTLLMARQYYDLPSYSLNHIAEMFQLSITVKHRALDGALAARAAFFAMMEQMKQFNKPLDHYIGIYNSPVWPDEGIQLPTELGEAIYSNKRFIHYVNADKETMLGHARQVMGLKDYVYLQAYCHLRNEERNFRLDRIIEVKVEE